MDKLRCLSIHQPYAELICQGAKVTENRSWKHPTKYRGVLLIHATVKRVRSLEPETVRMLAVSRCRIPLTYGAIVAVVNFDDILTPAAARKQLHPAFHPHIEGPQCLMFRSRFMLPEPVPCKGFQGLWIPSVKTMKAVRSQLVGGWIDAVANKTEWDR